jgi:hypothetical protein
MEFLIDLCVCVYLIITTGTFDVIVTSLKFSLNF